MGYRVFLVAVASDVEGQSTDVSVIQLPRLSRLRRVTIGSVRAIRTALKTRATIFHLHDPELVWAIPLLRLMGKRVIYDAHEDLPVQILNKPYVRASARPIMRCVAQLVISLARLSTHVVSATETIAARFPSERVSVVHNYPPLRDAEAAAVSVLDRGNSLVYIGGIAELRGAVQMVDALGKEEFPDGWALDLAGTMPESLQTRLKASEGWGRVRFHGQLPPDRARDLLLAARVGLVVLQDTEAYRESLPTKMFEYFAAGVPVIASDFPLWNTLIEEFDCGVTVDQTSPSAIASAVARYANDPELLQRHSTNARRVAVEMLNWASEEPTLQAVYRRVSSR